MHSLLTCIMGVCVRWVHYQGGKATDPHKTLEKSLARLVTPLDVREQQTPTEGGNLRLFACCVLFIC